jgi:hypothetical protein
MQFDKRCPHGDIPPTGEGELLKHWRVANVSLQSLNSMSQAFWVLLRNCNRHIQYFRRLQQNQATRNNMRPIRHCGQQPFLHIDNEKRRPNSVDEHYRASLSFLLNASFASLNSVFVGFLLSLDFNPAFKFVAIGLGRRSPPVIAAFALLKFS